MKTIGKNAFISAFVAFDSIKNCGYTYSEVISTCTDQLIDRSDYVASQRLGGEAMGNNNNGGMAFEDDAFGATLDEDLPIDTDVLEQRLVDEALHRSEETTVEDDQLRQALARSAELARAAEEIDL